MSVAPEGQPEVSVIIPARDAAETLACQLRALGRQTFDGKWEVIVVDNGSRDRTIAVARSWRRHLPRLRIIRAPDARGAAGARNTGGRAARGDLLLFCDADDVVDREWVARLAKGLRDYPAVGGSLDRSALNSAVSQDWRPARPTDALPDHFGFLPYAQSANCGVRRDVWEELGGFDERFRHSEDVAFFWRVQLAGHEVGFIPGAVVYYRHRESTLAAARQNFGYGRSHARLFREFAEVGMPRTVPAAALGEWRWIAVHAPDLVRSRRARGAWLAKAARGAGRLAGCLRSRTVYL